MRRIAYVALESFVEFSNADSHAQFFHIVFQYLRLKIGRRKKGNLCHSIIYLTKKYYYWCA